jgi:hypothetical protein
VAERATAWLRAHGVTEPYDLRCLADRGDDRPPEPTAPRADWQRWQREGADVEAAPATVAATLAHRGRRSALARAESAAAQAADEVAILTEGLAVLSNLPRKAEPERGNQNASPPEGAYTPKTGPAPISMPPAQSGGARKTAAPADRPDHYAACQTAWRAERKQARPDPRAALRARHKEERDRVFRATRPGVIRAALLAGAEKRQAAERVAVRAEALAAAWGAWKARETLDAWVVRQAAAGHPAALALKNTRERAAAARARRDPAGEAGRRLAAWRAEAQAALAAAPPGLDDIRALADAATKRAIAKEIAAQAAAKAARQAARDHGRRSGWLGGLLVLGRSAVAEHRRLVAAAAAAERRVPYATADRREEETAARQAAKMAERAAKEKRHAWTTGVGATAGDRLAALDVIQCALRAADAAALAAVLAGDEHAAGRAAEAWQAAPRTERAASRSGPAAADPRAAALANLARHEMDAGCDPARHAAARAATAAAVRWDPATIAAAAAGDTAEAERAAATWEAMKRAEADAAERDRRRRAELARCAADRQDYAGPNK